MLGPVRLVEVDRVFAPVDSTVSDYSLLGWLLVYKYLLSLVVDGQLDRKGVNRLLPSATETARRREHISVLLTIAWQYCGNLHS